MLRNSPTALRVLKSALNAAEDGQAGIQVRLRLRVCACAPARAQRRATRSPCALQRTATPLARMR